MSDTIPFATQSPDKMITRGTYPGGYPKGLVFHHTAGNFVHGLQDAINTIKGGIHDGYTYLCISRDGHLVQAHPVSRWGYHAGQSAWTKFAGAFTGGANQNLIGVENCNAGILTKKGDSFFSYWGALIPKEDVRYVTQAEYGCPTGYYHKLTPAGEHINIRLALWLKNNDPLKKFNFDDVLAHHEVSGVKGIGFFRKNDIGGGLSLPMDKYRAKLKDLWAKGLRGNEGETY